MDELQREWYVITNAPVFFVMSVGIVGGVMWLLLNLIKSSETRAIREQKILAEQKVAQLQNVIRDLRPEKTAYMMLSNDALKDRTADFVKRLRAYYERESAEEIRAREREETFRSKDWPTASLTAGQRLFKLHWTSEFEAEFKTEAVLLRNELFARLSAIRILPPGGMWGPAGEYKVDLSSYGSIDYIVQIESLATHLEALYQLLPSSTSSSATDQK